MGDGIDLVAWRAPHDDTTSSAPTLPAPPIDKVDEMLVAVDPTLKNHTIDEDARWRLIRDIMQSLEERNRRAPMQTSGCSH